MNHTRFSSRLHLPVTCRRGDPRLCALTCIRARVYTLVYFLFFDWLGLLCELVGQDFYESPRMDEKVKCTSPFALEACPIFRPYALRRTLLRSCCCRERGFCALIIAKKKVEQVDVFVPYRFTHKLI